MLYRKKPVTVEALTWAELVELGIAQCKAEGRESGIVGGMPWSFKINGQPITHENDRCYLIATPEGVMQMTPEDMLIIGVAGEIYPCKRAIFDATYEPIEAEQDVLADLTDAERQALATWDTTRNGDMWTATNGEHHVNVLMESGATFENFKETAKNVLVTANIIGENDEVQFSMIGDDHE
jgi:hypothetical protein